MMSMLNCQQPLHLQGHMILQKSFYNADLVLKNHLVIINVETVVLLDIFV